MEDVSAEFCRLLAKGAGRPYRVIFIRHGESERNKVRKGSIYFADDEAREQVKGISDDKIPLTEIGWEQAKKTGLLLRSRFGKPDYLYHSGYLRTIQTTEGILNAYPLKERDQIRVRMSASIRERHAGYAYDMTKREAEAAFPWLAEYWKTHGGFIARPPGGDSLADVVERVYKFINMLFRDRAGMDVWAVTHGGTLRCIRFLFEHWTYDQAIAWPPGESPKNCGLTVYQYDPEAGRLVLREYNTVA
ncbi:MAG: histidine phosphatase family protein [Candidatus Vogelbacteria bacterium]|nr:histidine phosphatase family protein [Candidatus Vogelbacteria bacterium]